jgi:hypothetical protein
VDNRFHIRCLEARVTEDIPLVKLSSMGLEMGHRNLTNRVTTPLTLVGN